MPTLRQQKVARLIQKEISDIFLLKGKILFGNAFITVTGVRITPDLSLARIHVSLFKANDRSALLEKIKLHTKDIRRELGNRVAKQLRITPSLEFYIDDSLDYVEKIDSLLKK